MSNSSEHEFQAVFGIGFLFGIVVTGCIVFGAYFLEYLPTGCR